VTGSDDWLAAALVAFVVATVTTPAGVSGAVLLLPAQISVFHVPNPSLTPTNLLYNVIATPGALWRQARDGGRPSALTRALVAGAAPGMVAGAILRVEVLAGPRPFLVVVAAVLAPLGMLLLLRPAPGGDGARHGAGRAVTVLAFGAGLVGGVYGIGGGSLLAPILAGVGYSMYAVAPAALTSTWVTSVAGVVTFQALELVHGNGAIAPQWALGVAMGAGGLFGGVLGAHLQPRVPETVLRRLLGLLCLTLAVRYGLQAAGVA
jgi:uncharacterized membrane protein YfcA